MEREKILAKSREENKDKDIFEQEVLKEAGNAGAIAAAVVAGLIFITEIICGRGIDYGLWAVVTAIEAAVFNVKAIRLKRKHEMAFAILYTILTLMLIAAHLYNVITAA